jgi:signal transduction histidine kinase/FixJ family two-component response regulator
MPQSIYNALLAHEGMALFEFRGKDSVKPMAALPAWCDSLWHVKGNKPVRLTEKSPFVEDFIAEAEEFWDSNASGAANLGNWIEKDSSGTQYPLESSAFWLAGKRVLLIRNLSGTFSQQKQLFQTARDSLLTRERLQREIQKKEILLHCIIHDLSQPLTSMRGCFDLLLGKKLPPDVAKFAHTGQRESQRQERMIRGILEAFSSDLAVEGTANQADAASADLISCARRAVEQFTPVFTERGIQVKLAPHLDSECGWRVVGDTPRIDRIFGNLLENALRYSPNGSTVTVGVEDSTSTLTAFVDDEGPGLPEGTSPDSLFALFSKGKDRPGKSGLGLCFCKMTVERWGGAIGAENRPDGGSRFWFRLPHVLTKEFAASSENSVGRDSAGAPVSSNAALKSARKKLRIVVADDDEAVRDLSLEILRGRGHSVTGAPDGRSALAAFERVKPDVLLLDQQMPEMDGLQLARAIRAKEKQSGAGPRATLIGLSGNASSEDQGRALDAGMDAFLSKPFDRNTLFQLIERSTPSPPTTKSSVATSEQTDLRAHLTQITAGNEELARRLVTGFLQDFPSKLSAIERAISRKDADALASAAHALLGAFAIFNAQKSVAAARNLEAMGRERHLQDAPEDFRVLSTDLGHLERELRDLFPQAASRSKPSPASHSNSQSRTSKRPSRTKR